jgi:hypothetical protein
VYGINLYKLCTTPDGFLLNVLPYSGENTVYIENGHAFSVVYFSSYKNETHVVGTLKKS